MTRVTPLAQIVDPRIVAVLPEFVALRRDLHRHPELAFREDRTSTIVADRLTAYGFEVARGIGGTGVVGTLRRGNGPRAIGIRADMDAMPIPEATGLPYASAHDGAMHACGHDGHTTILLAAARYLAEHARFRGTVHLIFQPAEEIGAGAKTMLAGGLLDRFPVDAIFGLHNWPGIPAGHFGFVDGPAMASVDLAIVRVVGKGGHGAAPHETVDPVLAAAHIVTALQSVVSRNVDPLEMGVVTVGSIHGGTASNIIPDTVDLAATIRSFRPEIRTLLGERVPAIIRAQAESFGARAEVTYRLGLPPVVNHRAETGLLREVAADTFGPDWVVSFQPRTASEDFSYFLAERPGSFLFVGNGDSAALHNPSYDFNDDIIGPAATLWGRLVERVLI
ncbi:M20 aminoacylase family protein [Chelatococcus asaccharovorans]|uniref:Hippurate hydrolase n=1 Tax=Chelatococcus asaccharovorans TaxID=28210 RepID=A0A2V3U4R6_9HYPH|nr:M20 aminoacylase family protein [Chelatococcus asaccharovorans]MBS7703781.1 amidohydrolase [Chelatococcus asaccharovorans]PXW57941.1 hippurate hydrolase [Chelatococcus asaccharovorans]